MNVFAKIFTQIFDSSISRDYMVRHVFMDLLVLADRDGVVDMTLDAISRRTNVPEEIVAHAIAELSKPDTKSRSKQEEGCRIVLLDSHRDWGWQIVNYDHYRHIRDEESRRAYFRDKKREYRAKSTSVHSGQESPQVSTSVLDSPTKSTEGEGEGEGDTKKQKQAARNKPSQFVIPGWVDKDSWEGFEEMRKKIRAPLTDRARAGIVKDLQKLCPAGNNGSEVLQQSINNAYRGVFELKRNGNGTQTIPAARKPTAYELDWEEQKAERREALRRMESNETR